MMTVRDKKENGHADQVILWPEADVATAIARPYTPTWVLLSACTSSMRRKQNDHRATYACGRKGLTLLEIAGCRETGQVVLGDADAFGR
jgi:hypothetical protein